MPFASISLSLQIERAVGGEAPTKHERGAMKRAKAVMDFTDNEAEYAAARKEYIFRKAGKCPLCPPHRWENASKPQRSWKRFRHNSWRGSQRI
jgi:hypothetical protein